MFFLSFLPSDSKSFSLNNVHKFYAIFLISEMT